MKKNTIEIIKTKKELETQSIKEIEKELHIDTVIFPDFVVI